MRCMLNGPTSLEPSKPVVTSTLAWPRRAARHAMYTNGSQKRIARRQSTDAEYERTIADKPIRAPVAATTVSARRSSESTVSAPTMLPTQATNEQTKENEARRYSCTLMCNGSYLRIAFRCSSVITRTPSSQKKERMYTATRHLRGAYLCHVCVYAAVCVGCSLGPQND